MYMYKCAHLSVCGILRLAAWDIICSLCYLTYAAAKIEAP